MTTIRIKLRLSALKNNPGRIIYQITHRRIVRYLSTNYMLFRNEWDDKHQMVIFSSNVIRTKVVEDISRKIHNDVERLNRIIANFNNRYCEYTIENVVNEFIRLREDGSFFNYMNSIILRFKQLNRIGTANNYRATLNSFKRFRNNEDVMIEEIEQSLIEDYQSYLIGLELVPNSISFYMRILRAVYNRAVKKGITYDKKPFCESFTGMEKTVKRAISFKELKKIKDLNLSHKPNLEFARDIFLFLFYCRGMSFVDAAFLKKDNINNGVLSYRRHKTNQLLHIKIIEPINKLIVRYSTKGSPYLLTIITKQGVDGRKQYEAALRRVNNALKSIAENINLQIPLTTYVARHTWATIAKSKNISINVISDALGHDSILTTQIYLSTIDASIVDKANELVVSNL